MRSWSAIAQDCVAEYNKTSHEVTGFSPDYLMNGGSQQVVPVELFKDSTDWKADRKIAFENSKRSFLKNKNRVDKNRREWEFKVDDLVYIRNGSKLNRKKLDEIRSGPFKILKKISNLIFEIQTGRKRKDSALFHSNKLFPMPNFSRA